MSEVTIKNSSRRLFWRTADERSAGLLVWTGPVIAAGAWFIAALITAEWPEPGDWARTNELAVLLAGGGAFILAFSLVGRWLGAFGGWLGSAAPWFIVLAILVAVWEIVTAKLVLLPMPFFPPPQAILEVFFDDWARLADSALASFKLLATGYLFGASIGFVLGVAMGWSKLVGYWAHPILRFIGPLPATAWLPIAFFMFPSSWSAATFLIALATGFPVTVLTWSGVAGVSNAYYDIARTLGANQRFLVLKVAIPAAMPYVFVGLFMGLGGAFAVLVVAEMLGVKSGLG